jgi:hypothetical protein
MGFLLSRRASQIGIGRKTGYRWRAEAGGLPPDPADDGLVIREIWLLRSRAYAGLVRRGGVARRLPFNQKGHLNPKGHRASS